MFLIPFCSQHWDFPPWPHSILPTLADVPQPHLVCGLGQSWGIWLSVCAHSSFAQPQCHPVPTLFPGKYGMACQVEDRRASWNASLKLQPKLTLPSRPPPAPHQLGETNTVTLGLLGTPWSHPISQGGETPRSLYQGALPQGDQTVPSTLAAAAVQPCVFWPPSLCTLLPYPLHDHERGLHVSCCAFSLWLSRGEWMLWSLEKGE